MNSLKDIILNADNYEVQINGKILTLTDADINYLSKFLSKSYYSHTQNTKFNENVDNTYLILTYNFENSYINTKFNKLYIKIEADMLGVNIYSQNGENVNNSCFYLNLFFNTNNLLNYLNKFK